MDEAALATTVQPPVENFRQENVTIEDQETNITGENNQGVSPNGGSDSIDKLTALEMLQLLKEYKKREFLYISQLSMLQKELYLHTNSIKSSSNVYSKYPFPYYPVTETNQLALLDPAVNLEIREVKLKLYNQGVELQKTKDELRVATFSADSVMGRRLINKCKALQEENTDIGKMLLENQLQPLQIQIGILEKQLAFFKQQLKVLHELNADLEEDNEKLNRQLQEVTVQYKTVQQERDTLLAEASKNTNKPIGSAGYESPRRSSSRGGDRKPKTSGKSQKTERTSRRRHGSRSYGRHRSGSGRRDRSDSG